MRPSWKVKALGHRVLEKEFGAEGLKLEFSGVGFFGSSPKVLLQNRNRVTAYIIL